MAEGDNKGDADKSQLSLLSEASELDDRDKDARPKKRIRTLLLQGSIDDIRAEKEDMSVLARFNEVAKRKAGDSVEVCKILEERGFNLNQVDGKDKYSPLHWAAKGPADLVAYLLSRRCGPDVKDSNLNQTPLFFAARYSTDNLGLLLKARACVNTTDSKNETALFYAIRSDKFALDNCRLLLEHKADVTMKGDKGTVLQRVSKKVNPELKALLVSALTQSAPVLPSLPKAAESKVASPSPSTQKAAGSAESTRMCIARRKEKLSGPLDVVLDGDTVTELRRVAKNAGVDSLLQTGSETHYEADPQLLLVIPELDDEYESERFCKLLLSHGRFNVDIADKNMRTPLFFAAHRGRARTTLWLLNHRADPSHTDINGCTPLHFCTSLMCAHDLLEKEAGVDAQDVFGTTPLFAAASEGAMDLVKLLLKSGASATTVATDGSTPLLVSDAACVQTLVDARADPSSVMFEAVVEGRKEVVEALLIARADPSMSGSDVSLLELAVGAKNTPVMELLMLRGGVDSETFSKALSKTLELGWKHGEKKLKEWDSTRDKAEKQQRMKKVTDLKKAAETGNCSEIWSLTRDVKEVFDSSSMPKTIVDGSILLAAARGPCATALEVCQHFVAEFCLDVKTVNNKDGCPLSVAASVGNLGVAMWLLEEKCNVNLSIVRGETPLIAACKHGWADVASFLLGAHADLDAKDCDGHNALWHTVRKPYATAETNNAADLAKRLAGLALHLLKDHGAGLPPSETAEPIQKALLREAEKAGKAFVGVTEHLKDLYQNFDTLSSALTYNNPATWSSIKTEKLKLSARNASGSSFLHLAARNHAKSSLVIMKNLLDVEAACNVLDYNRQTPLFAVVGAAGAAGSNTKVSPTLSKSQCETREQKLLMLIEARADVIHRDATSKTALFHAVQSGASVSILKCLISSGVEVDALDCDGHACMYWAKDKAVRTLLAESSKLPFTENADDVDAEEDDIRADKYQKLGYRWEFVRTDTGAPVDMDSAEGQRVLAEAYENFQRVSKR